MDWDLKMSPWDMAEMEEANAETNIGLIVGSSSGVGQGLDCSVDLKLGGLGDFGSAEKWKDHMRLPTAMVSPSSSSKRARAPSNSGSQNVSCLVDGCKSDLSGCREYHRRHKVCAAHSKTPIVMVAGQEQRFCQQCSRFHLLVEFDEVKRSCRKRLDGHNRRRRKPQPESMNSASMFSDHQGNRYLPYPEIFPNAVSDPTWPVIVKTEDEPLYSRRSQMHLLNREHQHFHGSYNHSFKEGKPFPFLQDTNRLEPSICQPLLKTIASTESRSSSSKIFTDSDCALSLLSSPPRTLGQIVPQGNRIPMGQPQLSYGSNLGLGRYAGSHQASNHHMSATAFCCSGMEVENVGNTVLVSDGSDAEINCQGLFGVGIEGSLGGGSHALPFSWQ